MQEVQDIGRPPETIEPGGGGGAGEVGESGDHPGAVYGNGGDGVQNYINGTGHYWAGGGGGGTWNSSRGGNGGNGGGGGGGHAAGANSVGGTGGAGSMQVLLAEQILRRQEVQGVQTLVEALEAAVKMFMQAM